MDPNNFEPMLTRQGLAAFLTEHGFPISYSTLAKYCSPAWNIGPPPEGYWGKHPLYSPAKALAWAHARLRPVTNTGEGVPA